MSVQDAAPSPLAARRGQHHAGDCARGGPHLAHHEAGGGNEGILANVWRVKFDRRHWNVAIDCVQRGESKMNACPEHSLPRR